MTKMYPPEGAGRLLQKSLSYFKNEAALHEAQQKGLVLESQALLCDAAHNLHVDLGCMEGILPRTECAVGIADGSVRDVAILSRVNKPVCFYITEFREKEDGTPYALLSRRLVQEDCKANWLSTLCAGDVIEAIVTRLEPFGAFCDIGAGVCALLPIDNISVSRIPHPNVRFYVGQRIKVLVKSMDEQGRILLSHKELLGTWEENAARFCAGETVPGRIRSVEKYGIFIELAPNLAGLAEYMPHVQEGESGSVYIKSICPEKMKIKLILIDHFPKQEPEFSYRYPSVTHIDRWLYSPQNCQKHIETVFDGAAKDN